MKESQTSSPTGEVETGERLATWKGAQEVKELGEPHFGTFAQQKTYEGMPLLTDECVLADITLCIEQAGKSIVAQEQQLVRQKRVGLQKKKDRTY